ncbi:hypothetical protein ACOMHN_053836 [Nucella lapillus]
MVDLQTCDPSKILHTDLKDITKLSYIKGQVTFWNIGDRVPKEMTPDLQRDYNLRTDLSMRCMSTSYLRKYIKQFFQQNGNRNLQNLRLMFVDKLIREGSTSKVRLGCLKHTVRNWTSNHHIAAFL